MIFVTVGTHEQQFDRLVASVDELKRNNPLIGDVFIQTGYSEYKPEYCDWKDFCSYSEMVSYTEKSRIVITHGGPSSFMLPLQMGKVPIVVPRQKRFGEHVNDHQVYFCRKIEEQYGILLVEDVSLLADVIERYDLLVERKKTGLESHTQQFVDKLQKIIDDLMYPS